MNRNDIIKSALNFTESSEYNFISEKIALSPSAAGMKIFDPPIFGFGDPDDGLFALLKNPSAIGEHFLLPREWMPETKSVISFFLPFTDPVKKGNRKDMSWPSEEWLHGRIEGQEFINRLAIHLQKLIADAGYSSLIPALDTRFRSFTGGDQKTGLNFTSNWSERHAAFVCGLGTFGLSKGLITEKGTAGRFGSILTELDLPKDIRKYNELYEYCSMCGACIRNCPVNAISMERGKEHSICSAFQEVTAEKFKPRYGCGKCQVGVPCENRIPVKQTPEKI